MAETASIGESIVQVPLDTFPKYRFYVNSDGNINSIVKYTSATESSNYQIIDKTTVESINQYIHSKS